MRGRLRSLPTVTRIGLATALLAGMGFITWAALKRTDGDVLPWTRLALTVLPMFCLAAAGAAVILRPLQRPAISPPLLAILIASALLLPAAAVALPEAHEAVHLHPESFVDRGPAFWPSAGTCLLFGMIMGTPLVGLVLLLDRRDRLDRAHLLLAAGMGGLAGNLALAFHCPIVTRSHLLAGHVTVALGMALVLAAFHVTRRRLAS